MMWLETRRAQMLTVGEPSDLLVRCWVDVCAYSDFEDDAVPDTFIVGRLLADEMHRWYIEERGGDLWEVADCDSADVEAALASLLDKQGKFREADFDSVADPVVFVYRFELHPDFAEVRLAIFDMFCQSYGCDAIVLAPLLNMSETELRELGFKDLPPTQFPAPVDYPCIDRVSRFKYRLNNLSSPSEIWGYPEEVPLALEEHEEWLESRAEWGMFDFP